MPRKPSEAEAEVRESAHKVWLAGLGALALAQDGAGKLFETLVSRGKDVETRGSGMLKDARGKVEDAWKKVGKEMDEQVVAVEPYLGHRIQGLKSLKEAYVPGIFEHRSQRGERFLQIQVRFAPRPANRQIPRLALVPLGHGVDGGERRDRLVLRGPDPQRHPRRGVPAREGRDQLEGTVRIEPVDAGQRLVEVAGRLQRLGRGDDVRRRDPAALRRAGQRMLGRRLDGPAALLEQPRELSRCVQSAVLA